ncbi:MAG: acyl-CoA dehydrogenase family protein [Polyangiaceae bacterium]
MLPLDLSHATDALLDPPDAESLEQARIFDAFAREAFGDGVGVELERTGTFPEKQLEAFARLGLISAFSPGSADWSRAVRTALLFSAHEPDALLCLGGAALGSLPVLVAGNEAQKAALAAVLASGRMAGFGLSEWDKGLDILGNEARAEPLGADGKPCALGVATHFRLRGTKAPVNNATRGSIVTVLVRTAEGTETNSQSLFMIEREKTPLTPGKRFASLGYRNMDLSSIVLDGAVVPSSCLLGKAGEGFHHARRSLEISRGGVAAMAAGLSVRAVALAMDHAEGRVLYGAKVREIPAVKALLAQSHARMLEGVALARFAARMVAHATVSSRHITCAGKLVIPQLLEANVHDCGTVLGARSLLEELPFARLRRTAPVYGVFDGSTPLQKEELWRSLIAWRTPGSLSVEAFRERMAALTAPSPTFDAYRDDSELCESMTPPAVLSAAGEMLSIPSLGWLGSVAAALIEVAPVLRRAPAAAKHAASEAAGSLYSLSAFAALTAVANEGSRALLLPSLRLRASASVLECMQAFATLKAHGARLPSECDLAAFLQAAADRTHIDAVAASMDALASSIPAR